jgi:hypothetical protein
MAELRVKLLAQSNQKQLNCQSASSFFSSGAAASAEASHRPLR